MTRVVVLGGGSAGEAFVGAFRRLDRESQLTLVERALVGGECTFWACMPSKTLLRSPELVAAARRAPGAAEAVPGTLDVDRVFWWRDQVVDSWDDEGHGTWLADRDTALVRGDAVVAESGLLDVGGTELPYDKLVVATGSRPVLPPVEGIADVPHWTTADATSAREVPQSLVVVGGGASGVELAQLYRRLGAEVTIVQRSRLLTRMAEEAASFLQERLEAEGVRVRRGAGVSRVDADEGGATVTLDDGEAIACERLLVATGRTPNMEGIGLEKLGVELGDGGIVVDEHLQAAEGVWAIGDVTGISLFTHVAKYQARVAAANVSGQRRAADYRAVPAVVFTDPQVAQVGRVEGDGLVSATWEVNRTSRSSTYERPRSTGFVKLVADPGRRVLVGAVAVGPEAGEWLQQATLAIRGEVPVDVLRDTIQPFPTFSEAIAFAARDLPL
ncbi:MAG TPA: NAD(P)/FAD-dependent oxidoreductase [Gaiellaceae bacterium]|nr:NAD(P)/FAD-dependent oxidoreductase [Gaiellaceae bacterium]